MRVAETVGASYRLLFANLGAFFAAAVVWTLLATAARALMVFTNTPAIEQYEILIRISPYVLGFIFAAAGSICIAIVWHRFIVLAEPVIRLFPTTTDVIGPYTVRAIASMIIPVALYIAVAWVYVDDSENLLVTAIAYAGTSIILAGLGPLLLVLPASAAGDKATTVRASLNATRGHNAAIFFGLLACDLPWNILAFAADAVLGIEDEVTLNSTLSFALTQFFDLARTVTWTAFMSYAYLEFVRPTQTQAEQFS